MMDIVTQYSRYQRWLPENTAYKLSVWQGSLRSHLKKTPRAILTQPPSTAMLQVVSTENVALPAAHFGKNSRPSAFALGRLFICIEPN